MADLLAQELPEPLAWVLRDGWGVDEAGAFLLRSQTVGSRRPADLDLTGWEAFHNHVHVPQDDLNCAENDWPSRLWSRALAFACQGLRSASRELVSRDCVAIVALGSWTDGATVRFHLDRDAPAWISDDLEGYKGEAVAVLCLQNAPESPTSDRMPVHHRRSVSSNEPDSTGGLSCNSGPGLGLPSWPADASSYDRASHP